jgi:hypothetical protein
MMSEPSRITAKDMPTRRKSLRITDDKWKKYIKLIQLNYSEVEAARKVQIAHSTVMLQKKNPTSNLNRVMAEMGNETAGLFTPDKVSGEARRALEDFGYFRERYFARSASPWMEDAAYKILDLASSGQKEYVVVNIAPGVGKALALHTPLATPTGWTTMGEVQVGDFVLDGDGNPCQVTGKTVVFPDRKCAEILNPYGESVVADLKHEWKLMDGSVVETENLPAGHINLWGGQQIMVIPHHREDTQCIEVDSKDNLFLAGKAKLVTHNSTFFSHDLPIWLAVKDRTRRTMIGSRTASQAQNYTGRIRKAFERSYLVKADANLLAKGLAKDATGNLIADFGRFKPTNADRWRVDEFFLAQPEGVELEDKEPNFASYGMDGDVLGNRFNFVIWDDLVDRTNTKTEDARDNLVQLWESAMENRLEPNGLLILQGQRIASNDLYRYALDQVEFNEFDMEDEQVEKKKIYHHIVYKAHYDELCGVDGAGKPTHSGPWTPGNGKKPDKGCLLDPHRLPYKEIGRLKANRLNRFLLTYQQEDVDTEGSLIKQEWIDGGMDADKVIHQGCWDNERAVARWPKDLDAYSVVMVDPSPTKYWACLWVAYDAETKYQYMLDLHRGAMGAGEFLDWNNSEKCFTGLLEEWWLRSNDQGHPFKTLIFEANAAQRFLLQFDHFKRWSSLRGVTLVAHQTNRNKSDENYGVQTLAPHYQAGRVRFPGGGTYFEGKAIFKPMIKELIAWPEGSTDDTVMAHWFLIWNAPNLFDYNNTTPPQFKRPSWMYRPRG